MLLEGVRWKFEGLKRDRTIENCGGGRGELARKRGCVSDKIGSILDTRVDR
jgi:hypothetical protein